MGPKAVKLLVDPAPLRESFRSGEPFPHAVIDGLFEDEALERVLADFPGPDEMEWRRFDSAEERKLGYDHRLSVVKPEIQQFLYFMNSFAMIVFLEALTGIEGLIPDPYYGGGGPHQILPGGYLGVHADFNWHPILRLDRRLNVLVYLNRDWREEYGGHLELWDREARHCVRKILPVFNRTIVFATTDFSFHGHPEPLRCPSPMTRKSISLYYYSNGRPAEERSAPHETIFR